MTPTFHRHTIERLPAVLQRTGLGRSTLYALVARNDFPAPVRLTARAVGWRTSDVEAWLESRESTSSSARLKTAA